MEELIKKHHSLIEYANLMSLRVVLILPKDIKIENPEPRVVANLACSLRETEILNKLEKMERAYRKYRQYSDYEPREIVISMNLYARIKDRGLYCKRVFK